MLWSKSPMAELSPHSGIFSAAAAIFPNFCVKCIKHRQWSSTPTGKILELRNPRRPRKKMDLLSGSLKMTQLLFCRNIKTYFLRSFPVSYSAPLQRSSGGGAGFRREPIHLHCYIFTLMVMMMIMVLMMMIANFEGIAFSKVPSFDK